MSDNENKEYRKNYVYESTQQGGETDFCIEIGNLYDSNDIDLSNQNHYNITNEFESIEGTYLKEFEDIYKKNEPETKIGLNH